MYNIGVHMYMVIAETQVQLCMCLCISNKSFKVNCILPTVSEEFGYICTKQFNHNYKYSYLGCCNAIIFCRFLHSSRHKQDNCEVYSPAGQGY